MFALCKEKKKPLPTTEIDWQKYKWSIAIKTSKYDFTLLEIEHDILRRAMCAPRMASFTFNINFSPNSYSNESKAKFYFDKKEELLNFALYIPTKSSVPLKIYKPENLFEELEKTVGYFLQKNVKGKKDEPDIHLPELFEWYAEDFKTPGILPFVLAHLPSECEELKSIVQ